MAIDAFIKIGDLDGEAKDATYGGWIDVLAWSWGASQSATMHTGGGGGGGKTNVDNLSITKYVDTSTTNLWNKCFTGKHYPEATLILRKAGDAPLDYMKIVMTNVLIADVRTGGGGSEDRLTESAVLNFEKVKIVYNPQDEAGAGTGEMETGFDIAANTPL